MGEVNVLSGGTEILAEMRTNLTALDELKTKSAQLTEKRKQLDKDIATKQKARDTEVSTTVGKRQAEMEASFDQQIEKTRSKMKEVRSRREKVKDTKVGERIDTETADLREEVRNLNVDLKAVFTKHQIPRMFNTDYFFSMYFPSEVGDFLIILCSMLIMLAIPVGVYCLIPHKEGAIWLLILLYLAIVALIMGIFMLIFKKVKEKHIDALREAKAIRGKISRTKKRIGRKAKTIRKDDDESTYGLEKYDDEMTGLESQIDDLIKQKKQALTEFENTTKQDIVKEITARYGTELDVMKSENDNAYEEQKDVDAKINSFTIEISKKYEAYVGKEVLSVSMIDSLTDIINAGDALTIADALAFYKRRLEEEKK